MELRRSGMAPLQPGKFLTNEPEFSWTAIGVYVKNTHYVFVASAEFNSLFVL